MCFQDGALRGGDGVVQRHGLVEHKVVAADLALLTGSAEILGYHARKYLLVLVDAPLQLRDAGGSAGGLRLTVEGTGLRKRYAAYDHRCGVKGFAQGIGEGQFGFYGGTAGDADSAKT